MGPALQRVEETAESSNTWGTSLSSSWNVEKMSAMTHWGPLSAVSIKTVASRSSPQIKSQDFLAGSKKPARKVGGVPAFPSPSPPLPPPALLVFWP